MITRTSNAGKKRHVAGRGVGEHVIWIVESTLTRTSSSHRVSIIPPSFVSVTNLRKQQRQNGEQGKKENKRCIVHRWIDDLDNDPHTQTHRLSGTHSHTHTRVCGNLSRSLTKAYAHECGTRREGRRAPEGDVEGTLFKRPHVRMRTTRTSRAA